MVRVMVTNGLQWDVYQQLAWKWERSEFRLPFDVLLLGQQTLKDAFLAKQVALVAAQGVDYGLQADAAGVEGLERVLPQSLPLRAIP
jgi:hypothetical protein